MSGEGKSDRLARGWSGHEQSAWLARVRKGLISRTGPRRGETVCRSAGRKVGQGCPGANQEWRVEASQSGLGGGDKGEG
jgi:hypothetical protein